MREQGEGKGIQTKDGIVVWIWFNGDMLQLRAEIQDAIPGLFWRLVIYSIIRRPSIWTHALIYRYQSVPRYERSLPTSLIHAIRKKVRSCRSSSGHHQTSLYCFIQKWSVLVPMGPQLNLRWLLNSVSTGCLQGESDLMPRTRSIGRSWVFGWRRKALYINQKSKPGCPVGNLYFPL